jgi:hypothetical protein
MTYTVSISGQEKAANLSASRGGIVSTDNWSLNSGTHQQEVA